ERLNVSFPVDAHVAITGAVNDGGGAMSEALARLIPITGGRICIGDKDIETLTEAVTGRRIAYVGPDTYLRSVSVAENLIYGLRHVPVDTAQGSPEEISQRASRLTEARLAGNLELDPQADWIDYESAGATGPDDLGQRILETLVQVGLAEDIFEFGLKGTIDPAQDPEFAAAIVGVRRALYSRLDTEPLRELVVPFDPEHYNPNATIGENLLFGTPVGKTFSAVNLSTNDYSLEILDLAGLTDRLLEMGHSIAGTVVELFAGLAPDHPFFEQVSFMTADDLPEFEAILKRLAGVPLAQADATDKSRLLGLPFSYIEPRHRLGLLDRELMDLVLKGRALFASRLPEALKSAVEFYDPDRYNAASSLQDNILLGRVAYGIAMASERVHKAIREVLAEIGQSSLVYRVGLEFNVGTGGKRLNVVQRQKIGLARALLKRPDLVVVNRALAAMEEDSQRTVIENVRKSARNGSHRIGLVWVLANSKMAHGFDNLLAFKEGVLVSNGTPEKILGPGPADEADDPVHISV
ncbi:MAG: ABC transporter ATP-binding protein, partial [Hyphomicrobiales bacterium]